MLLMVVITLTYGCDNTQPFELILTSRSHTHTHTHTHTDSLFTFSIFTHSHTTTIRSRYEKKAETSLSPKIDA